MHTLGTDIHGIFYARSNEEGPKGNHAASSRVPSDQLEVIRYEANEIASAVERPSRSLASLKR